MGRLQGMGGGIGSMAGKVVHLGVGEEGWLKIARGSGGGEKTTPPSLQAPSDPAQFSQNPSVLPILLQALLVTSNPLCRRQLLPIPPVGATCPLPTPSMDAVCPPQSSPRTPPALLIPWPHLLALPILTYLNSGGHFLSESNLPLTTLYICMYCECPDKFMLLDHKFP